MSKGVLYCIRNVFFPKKHDELVVKIKKKQLRLKELQTGTASRREAIRDCTILPIDYVGIQ